MRVHASPSLNKRGQAEAGGVAEANSGVLVRPGQSPVKQPLGASGTSPCQQTVQDTDDRIPKDSIYGTIRMKRRENVATEELARVEEDVDSLPPPPADDGYEDGRNLAASKPAPRKNHNQDVLDARSNRSFDSGLPDSSSTTSSTSPPGQPQPLAQPGPGAGHEAVDPGQVHRKSTSLDNVNLQSEHKQQVNGWKSFSLQRGMVPPTADDMASHNGGHPPPHNGGHQPSHEQMIAMKTQSPRQPGASETTGEAAEEDVYGRCTNMRLTSFTDKTGSGPPRDPRLIDLSQSAASTGNLGQCAQNSGSNGYMGPPANFNTLPAHMTQQHQGMGVGAGMPGHHPHNTLPARVGAGAEGSQRNLHFGPAHQQPSGRHFKPFDHRKINPMAEIQENPYEQSAAAANIPPQGYNGYNGHHNGGDVGGDNTYIVHHNTHIPHMPAELRHTNYGPAKPHLVHPQVLQHRDGIN